MQCGFGSKEILMLFKKYSSKIKYIDFKNVLKLIYGILVRRKIIIKGLNTGEAIERVVNEVAKEKNIIKIRDIKMPLLIPSIDVNNGAIYCFCSKNIRGGFSDKIIYDNNINIGKAVRASCSYPLIFSPCDYKNFQLVDGGIRENIPWKELKQMGADKVISVIFEKQIKNKSSDNIIDVVDNSLEILSHELLNYEIEGADYLLKIKTKDISLLDMKKIDELYEIGYQTGKRFLNNNNKLQFIN